MASSWAPSPPSSASLAAGRVGGSNWSLGGSDGLMIARRLRQQFGRLPKIVAVTGSSQSEDRDRAREAGIDDVRVKPIDLEERDRWLELTAS
ncbi:MAG: response regulator [Isosphaeraceae bacterium]